MNQKKLLCPRFNGANLGHSTPNDDFRLPKKKETQDDD